MSVKGSSPLTRGKHHQEAQRADQDRLIPAHAGKTSTPANSRVFLKAHPRSRGENQMHVDPTKFDDGSSPLTRGKPPGTCWARPWCGLIPAHAGKTLRVGGGAGRGPAHPRSRGENVGGDPQELPDLGSSPLTRGKRGMRPRTRRWSGLIPAHAGKTRYPLRLAFRSRAHPRSRGENL